jgi:hypothetical protein
MEHFVEQGIVIGHQPIVDGGQIECDCASAAECWRIGAACDPAAEWQGIADDERDGSKRAAEEAAVKVGPLLDDDAAARSPGFGGETVHIVDGEFRHLGRPSGCNL